MFERECSRKDFLRALSAAGLGGALLGPGALLRPSAAAAATTTHVSPFDLAFSTSARYRPFEIVAAGFEAVDDGFDGGSGAYRRFAPRPEQDAGTIGTAGGAMTISGKQFFALLAASAGPAAPYAAVELDVASFSGRGKTEDTGYAGLVADAANYVVASYNRVTQTVAIEVVNGGQRTQLIQASAALAAPLTFAFVLNENKVIALADTGSGFVPLVRADVSSVLDMRDPRRLGRYRYGFGARADAGTIAFDAVKAGYWGKAGVRDPHVVTWADGTPVISDGKVYLTLTNAGLGFFEFAHWGVYTLDLNDPTKLEHVGKIFWERGGVVVGDHAGHIVYDDAIGAFRLLVSNWGTFSGNGVLINSATFRGDVLHGVHVIRNPAVQQLPTDVSRWDPHMVRIDGRWWIAFVESPSQNPFNFHPALARGPRTGEFGSFALVGRDAARSMTEGMVMQKIGGKWYVLCSCSPQEGPPDGAHYLVYDLSMRLLGFLNAPYPTNNIPHPMVFPVPITAGKTTRYEMVTFDGTPYHDEVLGYGTHGDFYVMNASPAVSGYEFPPRQPPPGA